MGRGNRRGEELTFGVAPYTEPLLGAIFLLFDSSNKEFLQKFLRFFSLLPHNRRNHAFGQKVASSPSGICRADDIPEQPEQSGAAERE